MAFKGAEAMQLGSGISATHDSGLSFTNIKTQANVTHTSGNNTLGGQGTFDFTSRAIKTSIVLQNR